MHTLSIVGLQKNYETVAGPLHILRDVELLLESGHSAVITGPSGSGKSTLLYILGLLDRPTAGQVLIDGEQPHSLSTAAQADFRSRKIGFVFQDHHLLPQCTVLENVLIPTLAGTQSKSDAATRAVTLLKRVGLGERLNHRSTQLSGGERQRVAVCRALINQPALLLADEPTGNLDRSSAENVGSLLLEIAKEQGSILVCVTHSLELAARFERRYELKDGKLV
ncbi:ABC transporter ATP-binding protein [Planctomicrobium sp. SH527]|uniref:ABC transporter ATP-binding protein n=1 Tax=Planctomicrobium sp. SH527 TaxID=3448123 RepID=UPI003F5C06E8